MADNKIELSGIFSEGYGIIPKALMKRPDLTINEKSIIAYFLSFTGGGNTCFPSYAQICNDLKISKPHLSKCIHNIENKGYIKISALFPDNKLKRNFKYTLTFLGKQDKPSKVNDVNLAGKSHEPCCTTSLNSNNNNNNNNKNNNINNDFETIWKEYPSKTKKKKALKYFKKALKDGHTITEIKQALNNYKKSDRFNKGFIKDGGNWFEEWEEWINPILKNKKSRGKPLIPPEEYKYYGKDIPTDIKPIDDPI